MASPSLTERLADFWSRARYDDLPAPVVAMAKRALLDTLAVGVRGADSDAAAATRRGIAAMVGGEGGSATVWGTRARLPPAAAALANGTAAHAYEFDDFGGCGHSGAVVVPAVAALAERLGADGRRVILALAAGYDIAARITEGAGGYRAHNDRGWHSTGTCGTFGAAAGAALILGLDAQQFCSALGIAGSFAGGVWAFLADGAMTKRFHAGRAAENGVSAALLAEAGLVGPRAILDAGWGGFYSTYSGSAATPEATVAELGSEFRILRSGFKPYPCCRGLHSSIEALLDIMGQDRVAAADIERVIVHGAERTVRQFAKYRIGTLLDAQFSLPYSLAVAAVHGRATMDEYLPLQSAHPGIAEFMPRVEIVADRELGPTGEPDLEVRGLSGETWRRHVSLPRGGWTRPLDDTFLLQKAERTAVSVIGGATFSTLRTRIEELERVADFREVGALLGAG